MSLEANPGRYAFYQFARNLLFWLPVFFLYFASKIGLAEVLYLEGIYYAGVVVLEVPSGYAADRFGRRSTLVLACLLALCAHAVFLVAGGFGLLVVGQILLAGAMACNSGSDAALLYDSLVALGREDDYVREEGRAQGWGFIASALAALVGGSVAGVDLRLAYAASLVGAVVALGAALSLREPPAERSRNPFLLQLGEVLGCFRQPVILWAAGFYVLMTVLNHVPYEFYQPYLGLLFEGVGGEVYDPTPLAAGILMCGTMLLGAAGSRWAFRLERGLRADRALLMTTGLQLVVIFSMAGWLHPVIALLLLVRSAPGGIMAPILGGLVNRQLESRLRATHLSMMSLAGRLAFSISLVLGGAWAGSEASATYETLQTLLLAYGFFGLLGLGILAACRPGGIRCRRS